MDATVLDPTRAGAELLERTRTLGRHSDSAEHYTRTFLTPAHCAAAGQIAAWMREAGMSVRVDGIGNVIGRYGGPGPALMMGSHYDSVRNGGKYDGVLGILVPIACAAELNRRGEKLAHPLEVIAFSDEEGARYQTSFLASKALVKGAASLDSLLDREDADGVTLRAALDGAGLDPSTLVPLSRDAMAAYLEVHIEQGPVLLDQGAALGVVTSIASGGRSLFRVRGEAGHAGTVPMSVRRDALAAAAEMVLAIESRCASVPGVVGTVGLLKVPDGTGNVIPGLVEFTVDIRAPDDASRASAEADVDGTCRAIAKRRRVSFECRRTHDVKAVPCAGWLQDAVEMAILSVCPVAPRLPSGAGHDAMVMAELGDVGMMFVRCGAGGVSHNPAETVSAEDAGLAYAALLELMRNFRAA